MKKWLKELHGFWKMAFAAAAAAGVLVGALEAIERVGLRPVTNSELNRRLEPTEFFVESRKCEIAEDRYHREQRQRRLYIDIEKKKPPRLRRVNPVPRDIDQAIRRYDRQRKKLCR